MMNSIKNFISKLFTRTRTTQAELNEQFLAAAKRGDTATVSALLAAPGILVNQADNFGLTALMYAARHGHTATVTALLAAPGILVNQADNYGTGLRSYRPSRITILPPSQPYSLLPVFWSIKQII
jgi:ankyrin repeat protein